MLVGGIVWGLLGDRIGRRRSLLLALSLNASFGLLSAAAASLPQLMALRALAGLGVGGSLPVVFSLMAELCPIDTRGRFMALLASCWMLGSLFSASAGWAILPTGSWRTFVAVASLPAWCCAAAIAAAMPESPRYLLVQGRVREAEQVLRAAAVMNGRPLPASFSLLPLAQHRRRRNLASGSGNPHHSSGSGNPHHSSAHGQAHHSSGLKASSSLDGLLSSTATACDSDSSGSISAPPFTAGESGGLSVSAVQLGAGRGSATRSPDLDSAPLDPDGHSSNLSGSSHDNASAVAGWLRSPTAPAQQRHTYVSSSDHNAQDRSGVGGGGGPHRGGGWGESDPGEEEGDVGDESRCCGLKGQLVQSWRTFAVLFSHPLVSCTLPLAVAWIGLSGGWYCTVLWVPKYFKERGASGGSLYADTFAVSLANLPGNIASIFLVDWLGRRKTACFCMAGGCICALLFAIAPAHGVWPLLAACVFNAVSVPGWNSLDMISAELYPTPVRTSGFGLLNSIGRLSSIGTTFAAGALLDVALWAPLALAAVLLAVGSVAMMLLPESAGQPLEDSMDEEPYLQQQQHPQPPLPHPHTGSGGKGGGGSRPLVNASLGSMSQWTLADEQGEAGGGAGAGGGGGGKDGEQVGLLCNGAAAV
ncbi:MAG: hypothetical protein WDW38_010974 [Sanguina aurantia]